MMGKRRVKVMLAIDGLGIGGSEMVVRDLARCLDREAFELCICCTKGLGGAIGEELLRDGHDVFVLPGLRQGRADYLTPIKFRRVLRQRSVEIVHSHATAALLAAAPCRLTMPQLKLVHTFHYGNYPYDAWRTHLMECVCARVADRLIAVGLEQRRQIQNAYRLSDSRIETVWNGVRLDAPRPDTSFRTTLGTGDRLLIGTIAKLIEQKGLDDLLAVAKRCRDIGHHMQFVIVGEGPLRSQLEQHRRELGLEDTVVITGWIPDAAITVLPEFDVFFQPSRWEAMSIAVLEAMASGKAIVATKVGDNPHMLEDGITGLLCESGDIESMAHALAQMRDSVLRQILGRAARTRFGQRFTLEHMVHAYESVYLDLVEHG